jgi:hypothetical protein
MKQVLSQETITRSMAVLLNSIINKDMRKITAILCFVLATGSVSAQTYTPTPENLAARQEFQDAKFGMFIHWGASSVLGAGEWVMNNRNIRVNEYTNLIRVLTRLILMQKHGWLLQKVRV